ncbi:MAG: YtpR family tRNA-binding protein [Bacilli bacterium]
MRYGVFYNYQLLGDVLLIDLVDLPAEREEIRGEIHVLYHGEQIVGYNIFQISKIVKIRANGLIPLVDEKLLNVINSLLKKAELAPLPLLADSGFCIGKILTVEPHPESDHLHLTTVDIGSEILKIVCGAKNCKAGMMVPVAKVGTIMFDGTRIKETEVLGEKSYGMLCSSRELNLDQQSGLLELDHSYPLGSDFFQIGGNRHV